MPKSDVFNLVARTSAIFLLCGCALKGQDTKYSMTQATVQPRYAAPETKAVSNPQIGSKTQPVYTPAGRATESDSDSIAQDEFSRRIRGGTLVRFDFGLIIVQATEQPESLQPTAFTTDAIITSSIKSKIAAQPQLQGLNFRVRTDDGIVKVYAPGQSLDQAAAVINISLTVPDVRQIVYTMPSSV